MNASNPTTPRLPAVAWLWRTGLRACARLGTTIFLVVLISFQTCLRAVVKGSETAVSVQAGFTFPSSDSDNTMLGFGWFKNGFTLQDSLTSCTFDSIYPVSGGINLNGGSLSLSQDLIFNNSTQLQGMGTVLGNMFLMDLCSTITYLPANTNVFDNLRVYFTSDLLLTSTITFNGNCVLQGANSTLDLGDSGAIVVGAGSTLTLRGLMLKGVAGTNIACADDSGLFILDDVKWVQNDNSSFLFGAIEFMNQVDFCGSSTFVYGSSQTSTIDVHSQWHIGDGMLLTIGKNVEFGSTEPLAFADGTSEFKLDGCSFVVTPSGINLMGGKIIFDNNVYVDIQSTSTTDGISVGDGVNPANDQVVSFAAGAQVTLQSGHFVYNNTMPTNITSASSAASLIRDQASQVYLAQSLTFPAMNLVMQSDLTAPIQVAPGAILEYSNTAIQLPDAEFNATSHRYDQYTFFLDGNDELFLTKGDFPLNILVTGTNNQIHGNGNIIGALTLSDSNAQLMCDMVGRLEQDVTMNGGTLALGGDLQLDGETILTGSGTVDIGSYSFGLGTMDSYWTSTLAWQSASGSLDLNAYTSLSGTWTIQGNCTIRGNNNTLDLGSLGTIVVDTGASLRFQDIRLTGISGNNVSCLDDSGSILLDNMSLVLDGNFSFTTGSIEFQEQVDFYGTYTFVYGSSQTSTVDSQSTWKFTDGACLQIAKKAGGANQPLAFSDVTSVLHFDNATFSVGAQGMQLAKGTLEISNGVNVDVSSTSTAQCLQIGSGNVVDDPLMQLNPGSVLSFLTGHVVYDVTTNNAIQSVSNTAKIVRNNNTYFHLNQNMFLNNLTIFTAQLAAVTMNPGVNLTYKGVILSVNGSEFIFDGTWFNPYTNLLSGNQQVWLTKGTLPAYTYVMGTGNSLIGSGIVTGGVILANSSAALTWGLNGSIANNIAMNGSTLQLASSLTFAQGGVITGFGTVNLNNNKINFSPGDYAWTSTLAVQGAGGTLSINGDLDLLSTWTLTGSCAINGNGHTVDLSRGGQIVVGSGSNLTLTNVRLAGVMGNNIRCVDDTASIVLDGIEWVQEDDYTFASGSMLFKDQNDFMGSYTFVYDSSQTSTIDTQSEWQVTSGLRLNIGRQVGSSIEPLVFTDVTSILHFDNANFGIGSEGVQWMKGCLEVSRGVGVDVSSTSTVKCLHIGSGNAPDDMLVLLNPAAAVTFLTGHVVCDVTNPAPIQAASTTAKVIRNDYTYFYLKQNLLLENMSFHTSELATLTKADGVNLTYNNVILGVDGSEFIFDGTWYNPYTNLLTGNQQVWLTKGNLPVYTYVMGTGNSFIGNGLVTGGIILSDPTAELDWSINGLMSNNITLNGGTLTLKGDLNLGRGALLPGVGTVSMGNNKCILGPNDLMWTGTTYWDCDGGTLQMNSDVSLSGQWQFNNNAVLDGQGNVLDLGSIGSLLVAPGSTLSIKNIILNDIVGTNVACSDDAGIIILDNVDWIQDGLHTFTTGALQFKNLVRMIGDGGTFAYQSSQTSTIHVRSTLELDPGFTFSYDPIAVPSPNLLEFEDDSSVLEMYGGTLHATAVGMNLTTGKMVISRNSFLQSEAESINDDGIVLGDGNSVDDITVEILSGIALALKMGSLSYNNIMDASLNLNGDNARLKIQGLGALRLYQNLDPGSGVVAFDDGTALVRISGASITGSMQTLGSLNVIDI